MTMLKKATLDMPSLEEALEGGTPAGRLVVRIGLMSFAVLVAVGALMWWRFGPVIFVDMLAALQNCF